VSAGYSGRVRAAVVAASLLGLLYALVSAYWAAGGTSLISTVGGPVEELARRGGSAAVALATVAVLVKVVAVLVGLVLLRRSAPRLLVWAAVAEGLLLTVYGGLLVVVGAMALGGLFGPADNPRVLRWHVLVWDMWFLLWGLLLLAAAIQRRNENRRARSAAASPR
jgi:hypothetical protein